MIDAVENGKREREWIADAMRERLAQITGPMAQERFANDFRIRKEAVKHGEMIDGLPEARA
jgi:hypothetical protein